MASDLLAQFRLLIDHMDVADPEDQLLYFRLLDLLEGDVVQELAPFLLLASTTVSFRLLIAEGAYHYPRPEWVVPLSRSLRRESDLEVYGVSVRALARIGTPEAEEELRLLSSLTHEPTKRDLLSEALHSSNPERAFEHHLSRLFQGSGNPSVANQAASELRRIVGPDQLESLLVVVYHQDLLIARHALKLIARIPSWEAAQFLCSYFLECHEDILNDRVLKGMLGSLRALPVTELWGAFLEQLGDRFEERVPGALARLQTVSPEDGAKGLEEIANLRNWERGNVEPFLLDGLTLLLEGRVSRMPTLFTEVASGLQNRARRSPHALDTCAGGFEFMVAQKLLAPEDVLDLLFQAFAAQTGRETTARMLGALVSPEEKEILEAILTTNDSVLRASAQEAIGARNDARFLDFLLRACRDPLEDEAERMVRAAGGLPGAQERAFQFIASRDPEDVQLGLRLARANRMVELSGHVLAFLDSSPREDLSLQAIGVLGELQTDDGALLERFHSGQSLRVQAALAAALAGRDPEGTALELARMALPLRHPEVWTLAAEGLIHAWAPVGAMPQEASELLLGLIQACWKDHSGPWRMRIVQAIPMLQGADPALEDGLLVLLNAIAEDKRAQAGWTADHLNQLTVAIRHFRKG